MSAAETDRIEARFSPPQLGQTLSHSAVIPASSPSAAIAENTGAGSVYSLYSVSGSDGSDFTSKINDVCIIEREDIRIPISSLASHVATVTG